MEWLAQIILGLGVLTWSLRKMNARHSRRRAKASSKQGAAAQATAVDHVLPAADKTAPTGLNQTDDPLERHRIYTDLMGKAFHDRSSAAARDSLLQMGRDYRSEFDRLLPHLREEMGATPEILPLKWLTMSLEEDGRYEEAIAVCRRAEDWKISDGTKTGFTGRRQRIERKQKKEAHNRQNTSLKT